MTVVQTDEERAKVAYSLRQYGARLRGYGSEAYSLIPPENLVVKILSDYLIEEPRFVEALLPVVTHPGFDFTKLHHLAVEANIGNRVNWLLQKFEKVFKKAKMRDRARMVREGIPLFVNYHRSLENELENEPEYRRTAVLAMADPITRACGVKAIYDDPSLVKKALTYCRN